MKNQQYILNITAMLAYLCLYTPMLSAENAPLVFPCVKGKQIMVAAVGDMLFHYPLQLKASNQGFASLWQETLPFIQAANIAYGNLEGPISVGILPNGKEVEDHLQWKTYLLSRFPSFNYHPSVASGLKTSGFHIVSNANNHILDRGSLGIDRTIATLDQQNINHIGAKATTANATWYTVVEKEGL